MNRFLITLRHPAREIALDPIEDDDPESATRQDARPHTTSTRRTNVGHMGYPRVEIPVRSGVLTQGTDVNLSTDINDENDGEYDDGHEYDEDEGDEEDEEDEEEEEDEEDEEDEEEEDQEDEDEEEDEEEEEDTEVRHRPTNLDLDVDELAPDYREMLSNSIRDHELESVLSLEEDEVDQALADEPGEDIEEQELDAQSQALEELNDARQDIFSAEPIETPDARRANFAEVLRAGYWPLAKVLFKEGRNPYNIAYKNLVETTIRIFATMRFYLLQTIIQGNIARAGTENPVIGNALEELRRNPLKQPVIYQRLLVNANGESPTVNELLRIVEVIRMYCGPRSASNNQLAYEVDKWIHSHQVSSARSNTGHRQYLQVKRSDGSVTNSSTRRTRILYFCDELEKRLNATLEADPESAHRPLAAPLNYVGYARNFQQRQKSHERHVGSNSIMGLTEAVCHHLYRSRYQMKPYVIYLIYDPLEAILAEIFFSILCCSFVEGGGGFSHVNAGLSNLTATKVDHSLYWSYAFGRLNNTPFSKNMEIETVTLRKRNELRAKERQLAELEKRREELRAVGERLAEDEAEQLRELDELESQLGHLQEYAQEYAEYARLHESGQDQ